MKNFALLATLILSMSAPAFAAKDLPKESPQTGKEKKAQPTDADDATAAEDTVSPDAKDTPAKNPTEPEAAKPGSTPEIVPEKIEK